MKTILCSEENPDQDGMACTKPAHPFGMHAHDPSGTYWEGLPIPSKNGSAQNKQLMQAIVKSARMPQDDATWISANHPDTSQMTLALFSGKSGTIRAKVFYTNQDAGSKGATDDEIEIAISRSHQSTSGARNTLVKDGWIQDSGLRRLTRYGNQAIVWVATSSRPVQ